MEYKTLQKEIGKRFQKLRESWGDNIYNFSVKFEIPEQNLKNIEDGVEDINDILKYHLYKKGVNLNWLITGDGEIFYKLATIEQALVHLEQYMSRKDLIKALETNDNYYELLITQQIKPTASQLKTLKKLLILSGCEESEIILE